MIPTRPYLVRAMYEWIVDNDLTPYLLVATDIEEVVVPTQFVEDGKIVLNISPSAVQALSMGNDYLTFAARFGGKPMEVSVPERAILAIYAKENGQGMLFNQEDGGGDGPQDPTPQKPQRPVLKVVK